MRVQSHREDVGVCGAAVVAGPVNDGALRTGLESDRPEVVLTTLPLRAALRVAGAKWARLPLVALDRSPGGPERAGRAEAKPVARRLAEEAAVSDPVARVRHG